ncbi:MAG: Asp-tRNA(Asn)/Glu-tRNA(Gln) amidotransferase subunit GatC [Candidatus Nanoarchaeia archaeon]
MQVGEDLVRKVAKTARLELTEEQLKKYVPEFEEILSLFSGIKEVNTDNVHPSFHPIDKKNHLRDDVPERSCAKEDVLKLAEHTKDDYFKSPRALE